MPAPKSSSPRAAAVKPTLLPPSGASASFSDLLAEFHHGLGAAGISEGDLYPYQRTVIRELREPILEAHVASLYEWIDYDRDRLLARGSGTRPARPRVFLTTRLTSHSNLILDWEPDREPESDWDSWHKVDAYAGYRASNELAFIRDVAHLDVRAGEYHPPLAQIVDQHLIAMVAAVICDLERRLAHTFAIRWRSKLVLKWEEFAGGVRWAPGGQRVLEWSVERVPGKSAGPSTLGR